jgi:hypothetical protein
MFKRSFLLIAFLVLNHLLHAQQYFTKNGRITFFSKTLVENIEAENNQVISVIDFKTGSIQFSLLNNAFHFPKAKMEEDFNDDYIESAKYTKTAFKGTIADIAKISFDKAGTYDVQVTGDLNMHGVTKKISAPSTITVKDGKVSGRSTFKLNVSDYNIRIPAVVSNKVSNNIEITVSCNYEKK